MYYLSISNFKFSTTSASKNGLENLSSIMKSYSYDNSLILKCIQDGKKCLVYADEIIVDEINNLFKEKPIVYNYNTDLDSIDFEDIELKHLERYEVCFEYKIDKYTKAKDIIVEYNNKVYIFNSFEQKAIVLDYISDVSVYFEKMQEKIRDDI